MSESKVNDQNHKGYFSKINQKQFQYLAGIPSIENMISQHFINLREE